eukprot:scaffold24529_cov140-Isochrysis_galbana.AAC.9
MVACEWIVSWSNGDRCVEAGCSQRWPAALSAKYTVSDGLPGAAVSRQLRVLIARFAGSLPAALRLAWRAGQA